MTMPPNTPGNGPRSRDRDTPPYIPNPPVRKTKNWITEHWIIVVIVAVAILILLGFIGSEQHWFSPHEAVTNG